MSGERVILDTKQAAAFLCISRSTLAKWRIFGGGPPFYRLGSKIAYDCGDIDRWLDSRRRVSTVDTGDAA